jgi:drug/metabolite transporter (DMT)-like permease
MVGSDIGETLVGSVRAVRRVATVDLMLLATVLLWALNFTVTKYVLEHGFRPLAYSSVRYGIAAALVSGLTYAREGGVGVRRRDLGLLLVAAVIGIWLNQLTYVYALEFTTASTVSLILGATPVFAATFAWAIGLERLGGRFWVAAAVSFAGVALIVVGNGGSFGTDVKGDLLAIATAATWAAYSVAVAPLMVSYSAWQVSATVLLVGWVPLVLTGAPQLAAQSFHLPGLTWACLAYGVLGPLVLTNVLWFTALRRVGPSRATLFANTQPFFAAVFALLLLSESMTALQVGGGIAVGLGILLSRRRALSQGAGFRLRKASSEQTPSVAFDPPARTEVPEDAP